MRTVNDDSWNIVKAIAAMDPLMPHQIVGFEEKWDFLTSECARVLASRGPDVEELQELAKAHETDLEESRQLLQLDDFKPPEEGSDGTFEKPIDRPAPTGSNGTMQRGEWTALPIMMRDGDFDYVMRTLMSGHEHDVRLLKNGKSWLNDTVSKEEQKNNYIGGGSSPTPEEDLHSDED